MSHIEPLDQLYLLNRELMEHADNFTAPVITIGGQAVHYWVTWYYNNYSAKPLSEYITSNDVDFSARKIDVEAIAKALNVSIQHNENNPPPAIAIFALKNKDTGKIKEYKNKLFVNKQIYNEKHIEIPNVVDIIDWPAGFELSDFQANKLSLNTEVFYIPITDLKYTPHYNVRIINPIACMKSRFFNVYSKVKTDVIQEVERIKALCIPVLIFLYEKFEKYDFREAKRYFYKFLEIVENTYYKRFQVEYNIRLDKVLEELYNVLLESYGDFCVPSMFMENEFQSIIKRVNNKMNRKKLQIYAQNIIKKENI
ncbi:hypothetical protein [Photorhabdus luminescens]|uniref:hypothetical protein n=1 Tax=Photorhabdus luminescens TaxID=29488 RepID=UPI0022409280|nr:hypothetical protein [Photorhabdus luminescens]MCW7761569.1 hypothetical protein [Photorhabdus luminescens subsp. venezuelensis]